MPKTITQDSILQSEYRHGFITDIKSEKSTKGLNESIISFISRKKKEPYWMLNRRLNAFKKWRSMSSPSWSSLKFPKIDFQDLYYYSQPVMKKKSSLNEVDPIILKTYDKLGISLHEQKVLEGVAVDAVFDSVSIVTTHQKELLKHGVIFCSISDAVRNYPSLVQKYFGSVVPSSDNFYACLNAAVFTDGTFVYIPKGVKCPMELSTYFRINEQKTGQFERTLIIADERSSVSYLEGCTAPIRKTNQLHAAVVELIALDEATIKYSTVQNWYPGDAKGNGGIYNFVTKRGICSGKKSKISWTQLETGSSITWKYPSCILKGDESVGEFYSVALTNNVQQADTGTKMIHIGKNTSSTIISKGVSSKTSSNVYRGLVHITEKAMHARNYTQCDSLILGANAFAGTIPYIQVNNGTVHVEHEATTSRISEERMQYCYQRGISNETTILLIVHGFCNEVLSNLPMEFVIEARALLDISLEGSVA